MSETSECFTIPSLEDVAELRGWQLQLRPARGKEAHYRTLVLKFRLTRRTHPRTLVGPLLRSFDLTENDSTTIRCSYRSTREHVKKATAAFTRTLEEKLAREVGGGADFAIGKVSAKVSTSIAREVSDAWSTALGGEHVVTVSEELEKEITSTLEGISGKLKTVTVYQPVKHVEYTLRLLGYHALAITTDKRGVIFADREATLTARDVPLDVLVATTHLYLPAGGEQLHALVRRQENGAWVDETPPFVPEVHDAPYVATEINPSLAKQVGGAIAVEAEVERATQRALEKAKTHAGAAHELRAAEARALPAKGAGGSATKARSKKRAGAASARGVRSAAAVEVVAPSKRAARRGVTKR